MNFNNYYNKEPDTYCYLKKKLSISRKEFFKSLLEKNLDSHSQVKLAYLFANRLHTFIDIFYGKNNVDFLDCGGGLGFISTELSKLLGYNVYCCDPSPSIKKIFNTIYRKEFFFQSDIQSLPKFKKKYNIIYLREVYPFTRNANFKNQKKLIKILNNQLKANGLIIFEMIKNKKDLFDNLSKFNFKFKIIPLLPVKFGKNYFLNFIVFKSTILQQLIKYIYKLFNKKISYFILIYKFLN